MKASRNFCIRLYVARPALGIALIALGLLSPALAASTADKGNRVDLALPAVQAVDP